MGKGRYTWFFGGKRMKKEGELRERKNPGNAVGQPGILLEGTGARLLIDGLYDPAERSSRRYQSR
jgi:hypothetical protein